MTQPTGGGLLVIERLLRDRDGIWQQIIEERDLKPLTLHMLASSALSLALYGAVLGASNGALMALSSFVKLPLLFLATLAICLPTLYLFNLVFGARLSVMQAVTLIMVTITVTSVLTLAFAPISLFFLVTAQSYAFFKLLNVAILMLTALVGLKFLTTGMAAFNAHQMQVAQAAEQQRLAAERKRLAKEREAAEAENAAERATVTELVPAAAATPNGAPVTVPVPVGAVPAHPHHAPGHLPVPGQPLPPGLAAMGHQPRPLHPNQLPPGQRPASMTLLYIWILLFGFVGTQLAWTLRPFFGSPGQPYEVFRDIEGTFYADILDTLGRLLGG
ncbi:hypothetical protein [Spirilliplanes yamanashiensis]|uniref:Actin-binding WH2 domain-containing protein n=1 Tax=Spirilliplanes yamanashiensis TaxID=42233 RepID=A0A8J3Y6H4_9ACTN|nr:hypothetical protein [Spirilliplanes yamanashiensis]MDP9814679.1 hypothetical protein [Spirilliplanes yamanashiensis]GIJ02332.1 hypothetical protein Sya03_16840 [Spirilliplanes yamanashiensis]